MNGMLIKAIGKHIDTKSLHIQKTGMSAYYNAQKWTDKKVYIEMVRQVVESEEKYEEDGEWIYEIVLSYGDCRR